MSLVVAIRDNDRFVIGADKQGTLGGNRAHTATKVWPIREHERCIMAGVGNCRANQVMQYASGLIDKNDFQKSADEITEKYVVRCIVPVIFKVLEENGISTRITDEGSVNSMFAISNSFIFASNDKAWIIGQDLTVEEIDDYAVIGSGADIARGVLFATEDKNPFERIAMAIEAASVYTTTVDDNIDVEVTVPKEDDEKLFAMAMYGITEEEYLQASKTMEDLLNGQTSEEEDKDNKNQEKSTSGEQLAFNFEQ